jgi:hypothetical protein
MCKSCVAKSLKDETTKDSFPIYEAMLEKGMRLRDKTASEVRKAVEDDEEEPGGEEFLPDELILAAVLGVAFLRAGEPAVEQMFKTLDAEGIRALDKAIDTAEPSFKQVFSYGETSKKTKEAIQHVMRTGAGMAGSRTLIDDAFRTNEILDDMVQATKYFTNNYFTTQVAPQLRGIVQNAINTGVLDEETYRLVRQTMADRLYSVPYWRIVANAAASRGYHYGAVKAGMIVGKRAYRLVAVLDDRTSDICRTLNGKEFWLADAEVQATRIAVAENDEIKTVAPWVKNVEQVLGKSATELRDAGYLLPPFHANCRTTIQFV